MGSATRSKSYQTFVVDNLDDSTRIEWDDACAKNITWSIPNNLAPGDYITRAFGDAYYPYTENEIHIFSVLQLEDSEAINVTTMNSRAGDNGYFDSSTTLSDCPAYLTPFSSPKNLLVVFLVTVTVIS
ncbi:hypothetical protein FBU30_010826 [Linnemannia zychae]|nr:hypothetical protein FBU30_010826 [Linnemannia zychae]